jgi:hypothetical protein
VIEHLQQLSMYAIICTAPWELPVYIVDYNHMPKTWEEMRNDRQLMSFVRIRHQWIRQNL